MIYFIGAGPGAADLITVKGKELLEKCDLCIYAGSLVNPDLLKYCKPECVIMNSAHMTLEEVIAAMVPAAQAGKLVVRLHTGDPSVYGAHREQIDLLRGYNLDYEIVPGVSSFCAAAAALKAEYTLPNVSQSVIITRMEGRTPVPPRQKIADYAAHNATMVIFLSAGMLEKFHQNLAQHNPPATVKTLLGMLPANNLEDAPFAPEEDMNRLVEGLAAGADGREVIAALADTGSVVELGKGFTGAVTALGRMAGRTVAFVYTGKGDTCDKRMNKITRFVRFADCYNIPVVSLVDSTGFELFPTIDRQMSVMKAASALVYAYSEATTVKVTLVIGSAVGAMYVAMGGSANADATYAWPGAVISPMTGEAAIQVMWKDQIKASQGDAVKAREELAAKYEAEVADGVCAAAAGLVDDVIDPADSRKMVIAALELLSSKRDSNPPKKHGNMPL